MTDEWDELALAEIDRQCGAYQRLEGAPAWLGHMRSLVAEVRRLRSQVAGHCERIAKQSELLSRRAEGTPLTDAAKSFQETATACRVIETAFAEMPPEQLEAMVREAREGNVKVMSDPAAGLAWSPTPPAEPGWWWWRGNHRLGSRPTVVRVEQAAPGILVPLGMREPSVTALGGQWAGPLTPPAEAWVPLDVNDPADWQYLPLPGVVVVASPAGGDLPTP